MVWRAVRAAEFVPAALMGFVLAIAAAGASADDLVDVRIQLKWSHQFQFAGYYAAIEQGYFEDAGLRVTLLEGGPDINPTDVVLAGDAEFGIGTSGLLISRSEGRPVVAVAAIFQHSPYILLARDADHIETVHDLEGQQVMVEPYSEELTAYLHHAGVDVEKIEMIPHSGDPQDLYGSGPVAMTAYTSTEPYLLDNAGLSYRVFDPKVAGIDFYGDTLFTSEAIATRDPRFVEAVRDAVIEGWRYALLNQDEIIRLITTHYESRKTPQFLRYEADEIRRLLIPDLIEIGYMNPARWEQIAREFDRAGLMQEAVALDAFIFSPEGEPDWTWVYRSALIGAAVLILVTLALIKVYRLNRRLQAEILRRNHLEAELKALSVTDPGTGLLNRRGFEEVMQRECLRAERDGTPVSLLALDLDRFKAVNDEYGHAVGDRVLADFASTLRCMLREVDINARIGGEEFLVALPGTDTPSAVAVAERIRARVASTPSIIDERTAIPMTTSIGITTRRKGESLEAVIQRADQALYEAKRSGRNQTAVSHGEDNH